MFENGTIVELKRTLYDLQAGTVGIICVEQGFWRVEFFDLERKKQKYLKSYIFTSIAGIDILNK